MTNVTTRNNIMVYEDTSSSVKIKDVWLNKHDPGCPKRLQITLMTDGLFPVSLRPTGSCLSAARIPSDPTAECCNLEAIREKNGNVDQKTRVEALLESWAKSDSWEMLQDLSQRCKNSENSTAWPMEAAHTLADCQPKWNTTLPRAHFPGYMLQGSWREGRVGQAFLET